ncbi:MAG: hypothetical protein HY396_02200 [Candidatus Doudnabacteria bacterium]|nr:hypothetical protein [Candidatus Doudnabacteria bacterium]
MEQKELDQIKKVVQEAVTEGFSQIWDDNLEPSLNQLHGAVAQLPTKTYLDDKLADLEGGLLPKLRKEDEKINRLAEMLKEKKVLSESDIAELQRLQVFPK